MWIRPSSYYFDGTTTLKVILSNNRANYNNPLNYSEYDNCTDSYCTLTNISDSRVVGSWSISLANYPSEEWSRIESTFYVDEEINESYAWMNISTENFSECGGQYLFIDDVSFVMAGGCSSDCAPDLAETSVGTLPNVMIADGFCPGSPWCLQCPDLYLGACEEPCNEFQNGAEDCHCCPVQFFQLIVRNAIGVNFWVYARNNHGVILHEQHNFDANGLTFADQDYFVLQWMGRTLGGQHLQAGIYDYEIEIWNCLPGNQRIYEGYVYYEVGSQYYAQPPEAVNGQLDTESCCPYSKYFQNVTFLGLVEEGAQSFITAGFNVTSGAQGGVVVPPNANVKFRAGDAINLEPGFVVLPGGVFEAVITDCVYGPKSRSQQPSQFSFVHMLPWDRPLEQTISVFPNPTSGKFTLVLPEDVNSANVLIRDARGKIVLTHSARSKYETMEFTELARGMYFVEVYLNGTLYQSVRVSYE